MKKLASLLLISIIALSFSFPSDGNKIPTANVKKLDGTKVSSSTFTNDGKPMVISFWATWCKPCKKELDAIAENYADWQKETGVKLIAISIDDARSSAKVAPDVKMKGWEFEVYTDENQDFKRAMNVNMPPHTFVLNGKGEIVWQHVGFTEGNQDELYEVVKKVLEGKPIGDSK